MSANLVVDIGATAQVPQLSIVTPFAPSSGVMVGQIVDLLHYDTFCNIFVAGGGGASGVSSGFVGVAAQFSDSLASGTFADSLSGQASYLPSFIGSGSVLYGNSGLAASGAIPLGAPIDNASPFCSGGFQAGALIRTGRYGRLILLSGASLVCPIVAGFITNLRTTGSGGGQSQSPSSGNVSV